MRKQNELTDFTENEFAEVADTVKDNTENQDKINEEEYKNHVENPNGLTDEEAELIYPKRVYETKEFKTVAGIAAAAALGGLLIGLMFGKKKPAKTKKKGFFFR